MSKWLNTTVIINKTIERPCNKCGFCPYGSLIEEFPLEDNNMSCKVYGHNCPAYYHAEFITEKAWIDLQNGKNKKRISNL